MKKFIALVCMITCIFGLTACGSEEVLSDHDQTKLSDAERRAVVDVLPVFQSYADEGLDGWDGYTAEEISYEVASHNGLVVDGYVFQSGVESFVSAIESIGKITGIGDAEAKIDGDQIVVRVQVQGADKGAEAEIVFSNDIFLELESAALNPTATVGELMGKAALNTVVGMGTVFLVLILISLIISCFQVIPKIQAKFSDKNKSEEPAKAPSAAAHPAATGSVEESDDLELVAVIAAAVAASEGAASTDGFVVRSIRKVNRARR